MRITPQISRTQAWCKLATLIADGLPAPSSIQFYDPVDPASEYAQWMLDVIVVDGAAPLWRWAEQLGAHIEDPHLVSTGNWHQAAERRNWHGYYLTLKTYHASELGETADEFANVRAVATHDIAPGCGEVAGPDGGSGPATAPEADSTPAEGVAGSGGAEPATTPDDTVWVATKRSGITHHRPDGLDATICGRSMRTGTQLPQDDAVTRLAATPCQRCYTPAGVGG